MDIRNNSQLTGKKDIPSFVNFILENKIANRACK